MQYYALPWKHQAHANIPARSNLMRAIILASLLILAACGTEQQQHSPAQTDTVFVTVSHEHHQVTRIDSSGVYLRSLNKLDSGIIIHADSLSRTIRPGEIVRPCFIRTTNDRIVTWCRDRNYAR